MKKQFRSTASSGRAASGSAAFGAFGTPSTFGAHASPLSYVYEPPDLTNFTDNAIVVQFKNLMKKDGTTKSKALEEIQTYLKAENVEVEDALLAAYVKLYPRLSIDSNRRVRQLSHAIVGLVAAKSGKRMGPYMPQVAGPWFVGQEDYDKGVSNAAEEALREAFQSKQKVRDFPKLLHRPILDHCRDAILHETPQSLSDERSVSKEDSNATYYRVISTSIDTLSILIEDLTTEELQKQLETYTELITDKKIWEFTFSDDISARRAALLFLETCLISSFALPLLDSAVIGTILISKALHSDQTSTASTLVTALGHLAVKRPSIWTTYQGKKAPEQRLRGFMKKGSQTSKASFWHSSANLFKILPDSLSPHESSAAGDVLKDVLEGVTRREERLHAFEAWRAYLDIANILLHKLREDDRAALLQGWVLPIISQFLEPTQESSRWSIPAASASKILSQSLQIHGAFAELAKQWPTWTERVLDAIKTSLPEQSTDFDSSQERVESAGRQWVALQLVLLNISGIVEQNLAQVLREQRTRFFRDATSVLVSRNGKPYGAAALLDHLLTTLKSYRSNYAELQDEVAAFLQGDAIDLLLSPSQPYLIGLLYNISDVATFTRTWNAFATALTAKLDLEHFKGLNNLVALAKADQAPALAKEHEDVQSFLRQVLKAKQGVIGEDNIPEMLMACISDENRMLILVDALRLLPRPDKALSALETFEAVDNVDAHVLPDFVTSPVGRSLLSQVVTLQSAPSSEVAIKASNLHRRLAGTNAGEQPRAVSIELIRSELTSVSAGSVDIETILEMSRSAFGSFQKDLSLAMADLLPIWSKSLESVQKAPIDHSLSIMSPLAGMVHLLKQEPLSTAPVEVDSQGLSIPARIGLWVSEVLANDEINAATEPAVLAGLYSALLRTALLVDDEMSIFTHSAVLIKSPSPAVVEFVSSARKLVKDKLVAEDLESPVFTKFVDFSMEHTTSDDKASYAHALAVVEVLHAWIAAHGPAKGVVDILEGLIKTSRQSSRSTALAAASCALAPSLPASPYLQRYVNELISDLTGAQVQQDSYSISSKLAILNIIFRQAEELDGVVAKQRLVFFMRHILEWLNSDSDLPRPIRSEVFVALQYIMPLVSDIYGEHFVTIVRQIGEEWARYPAIAGAKDEGSGLCLVHSTIRLYNVLVSLSKGDDSNEDLSDALKEHDDELMLAALDLLFAPQVAEEITHTPQAIVNRLISRLVKHVRTIPPQGALALYPLLDAKSTSIQEAAFSLLQRYTEQNQEQISFDAVLDKKSAHLPEELLSFIFSAPSIESVMSASFETQMPEDLQSYLYSWLLVFSHFKKASLKVKEDYIEDIRAGDHLAPLLDLVYEFLGHTSGQPVDVSKFDIVDYKRDQEDDPEKDADWLLAHLYYLCLTYLPTLTKTHYLSITNRGASSSISKWIAKHFSPLIVEATMSSVAEWAHSFASDPEYENFSVKARPRAQEISASYLVDEQTMTILVRLPDAYPLDGARVESVSRVAVDARKWASWLRNCQGVIQFSNGDVVDGLSSWRRNVLGALKGQTECYICYSVISADRQLPSKRCGTCKNVFHSACLFKWFKTSNASSCPLCRTAFNYS